MTWHWNHAERFPLDPNAPPHRIVRGRAGPVPLDPNAPARRSDHAGSVRHPAPAARSEADRTADAPEPQLAQLILIGPTAGDELRRIVHGDGEPPIAHPPCADFDLPGPSVPRTGQRS
jgi:hypothetical protein